MQRWSNAMMSFNVSILSYVVVAAALTTNIAQAQTISLDYIGEAYDLERPDKLLYREQHSLTQRHDKQGKLIPVTRQVEYFSADGELIAEKTNQYSNAATQPDFILKDLRHNYSEQSEQLAKGWRLTLQENGTTSSKVIDDFDYELVIDAGFDDFIRKHWQALSAGKTVPFSFASVARQTSVNFEVEASNPERLQQPLKITMTLRSSLLSWLLDPIELEYQRSTQRLLRYRGLSNIQDNDQQGQQVDIRYRYFDGE
ncbi:hypothetical protein [Bacterioplanoides sp.]|uniref:hypothetical protein n=1 Tax=Bacterioplanoides sp. TaxID=2066072 RepID=UPI003B5BEC4A